MSVEMGCSFAETPSTFTVSNVGNCEQEIAVSAWKTDNKSEKV